MGLALLEKLWESENPSAFFDTAWHNWYVAFIEQISY